MRVDNKYMLYYSSHSRVRLRGQEHQRQEGPVKREQTESRELDMWGRIGQYGVKTTKLIWKP